MTKFIAKKHLMVFSFKLCVIQKYILYRQKLYNLKIKGRNERREQGREINEDSNKHGLREPGMRAKGTREERNKMKEHAGKEQV